MTKFNLSEVGNERMEEIWYPKSDEYEIGAEEREECVGGRPGGDYAFNASEFADG